MLPDALFLVVSRRDVEAGDLTEILGSLNHLISTTEIARSYRERVDIAFEGYDQYQRELWEIREVREFVYKLDEQFPYWLFFLDKKLLGLRCLAWCFLPPDLTEEAQKRIHPQRLDELLEQRWFPALNALAGATGISEIELRSISDRSVEYLVNGPTPS
jgi:hypothetical protein